MTYVARECAGCRWHDRERRYCNLYSRETSPKLIEREHMPGLCWQQRAEGEVRDG